MPKKGGGGGRKGPFRKTALRPKCAAEETGNRRRRRRRRKRRRISSRSDDKGTFAKLSRDIMGKAVLHSSRHSYMDVYVHCGKDKARLQIGCFNLGQSCAVHSTERSPLIKRGSEKWKKKIPWFGYREGWQHMMNTNDSAQNYVSEICSAAVVKHLPLCHRGWRSSGKSLWACLQMPYFHKSSSHAEFPPSVISLPV